jgi:hypothetical protein
MGTRCTLAADVDVDADADTDADADVDVDAVVAADVRNALIACALSYGF